MDDPRFSSAAARRLNFGALHQIIQSWMLTFPDMATLDAQFDEAKIAMGEIRSTKDLINAFVGEKRPGTQRRLISLCQRDKPLPFQFCTDGLGTMQRTTARHQPAYRTLLLTGLQPGPDGQRHRQHRPLQRYLHL